MKIQRYDMETGYPDADMSPSYYGEYVLYDDARAQIDALRTALEGLVAECELLGGKSHALDAARVTLAATQEDQS